MTKSRDKGFTAYQNSVRSFTDAFDNWTQDDFKTHIYNAGYLAVDPGYLEVRPRSNAGLVQQVFLAPTYAAALKRGRDLIAKFKDRYPAAMECLERDLEECVSYLRFPEAHHRRIRTTNRLERLNGEGRRRTKVIPRFPTERSCLTLLYASLVAASKLWRGIPMTAATLRQKRHH